MYSRVEYARPERLSKIWPREEGSGGRFEWITPNVFAAIGATPLNVYAVVQNSWASAFGS